MVLGLVGTLLLATKVPTEVSVAQLGKGFLCCNLPTRFNTLTYTGARIFLDYSKFIRRYKF